MLCAVGVEGEEDAKKTLLCVGCGVAYCDRECQNRDMTHFETLHENGCKARATKAAEKAKKKKSMPLSTSVFEMNPILDGMLRCGLRRTVFAGPELVPPLEQVHDSEIRNAKCEIRNP